MSFPRAVRIVAVLLGVAVLGGHARPAPLRILFIGNSLTYVNDLPAVVSRLARSAGAEPVVTATVAFPNFSLEDHWNDGRASQRLSGGGWDFVVMQQGPSGGAEGRRVLLDYGARFAGLARRAGARPAIYMVWPARVRFGDFDRVSETHRIAARELDGVLLPAGEAWRAAWRRDSTLALYGPDDFHPSETGTFVAAVVVVHRLLGRMPPDVPERIRLAVVEADSLF